MGSELQTSEELLQDFVDAVPALRFTLDRGGNITYVNPRWLQFTGRQREQLMGRGWLESVHPDDRARCQTDLIDAIEDSREIEMVFRLRRHDGEYRSLLSFGRCRATSPGLEVSCRVSSIDISDRTKMEYTLPRTVLTALQSLKNMATAKALDSLIEEVLSTLATDLNLCSAGLWLHDETQQVSLLQLEFERGTMQSKVHQASVHVPRELAHLQKECLHSPVVFSEAEKDARLASLRGYLVASGVKTLVMVPLFVGAESIGSVLIGTSDRRTFKPSELEKAQAGACQVALAVKVATWVERARQAAVLEERYRLAGDIHDSLAQGFTGIVVQLEAAEDALERDPDKAREHLERARTLARESLDEARRTVDALRFHTLDEHDLVETLRLMLKQFATDTGLRTAMKVRGSGRLPQEFENHFVRICQEALTNVVKHANAREVQVELKFDVQRVKLRIRDDGRGFDARPRVRRDGFGLIGMRLRAKRMNGTLKVTSGVGQGTTITASIPRTSYLFGGRGNQAAHE